MWQVEEWPAPICSIVFAIKSSQSAPGHGAPLHVDDIAICQVFCTRWGQITGQLFNAKPCARLLVLDLSFVELAVACLQRIEVFLGTQSLSFAD